MKDWKALEGKPGRASQQVEVILAAVLMITWSRWGSRPCLLPFALFVFILNCESVSRSVVSDSTAPRTVAC